MRAICEKPLTSKGSISLRAGRAIARRCFGSYKHMEACIQ